MHSRKGLQRGTHKWGFPFLYIRLLLIVFRFSFGQRGAKEKLTKEIRRKGDFALCGGRPTLRALDWRRLLKKAGENFPKAVAVAFPHKLQFMSRRKKRANAILRLLFFLI